MTTQGEGQVPDFLDRVLNELEQEASQDPNQSQGEFPDLLDEILNEIDLPEPQSATPASGQIVAAPGSQFAPVQAPSAPPVVLVPQSFFDASAAGGVPVAFVQQPSGAAAASGVPNDATMVPYLQQLLETMRMSNVRLQTANQSITATVEQLRAELRKCHAENESIRNQQQRRVLRKFFKALKDDEFKREVVRAAATINAGKK